MIPSLQSSKFKVQSSNVWYLVFGIYLKFGTWNLNFNGGVL
jgi:hypothetical protein